MNRSRGLEGLKAPAAGTLAVLATLMTLALALAEPAPGAYLEDAAAPEAWAWAWVRRTGRLPLWDPYPDGGLPLSPTSSFRPFYPPGWVSGLVSEPWGGALEIGGHGLLAALLMWGLCRRIGLGWTASLLGAGSWMLAAPLASRWTMADAPSAEALLWLPGLPHGALLIVSGRRRAGIVLSGTILGLQSLTGAYDALILSAGVALAAFLGHDLFGGGAVLASAPADAAIWRDEPPSRASRRGGGGARLATTAGAMALAALIGAPAWLPALEFKLLSDHRDGFGLAASRSSGLLDGAPWAALPPFHASIPAAWAGPTLPDPAALRLGAGVGLFLVLGLFIGRRRRANVAALTLGGVVAWALAAAPAIPWLHARLHALWPGYRHQNDLTVWLGAAALAWILAAAWGLEEWLRPEIARNTLRLADAARRRGLAPAEWLARRFRTRGASLLLAMVGAGVAAVAARAELSLLSTADSAEPARGLWAARAALAEAGFALCGVAGLWAFLKSLPETLPGREAVLRLLMGGVIVAWGVDLIPPAARMLAPALHRSARADSLDSERRALGALGFPVPPGDDHLPLRLIRLDAARAAPLPPAAARLDLTEPPRVTFAPLARLRSELGPANPTYWVVMAVGMVLTENPESTATLAAAGYEPLPDGRAGESAARAYVPRRPLYVRSIPHRAPAVSLDQILARLGDARFNPAESTLGLARDWPWPTYVSPPEPFRARDMGLQASPRFPFPGHVHIDFDARLDGWVRIAEPALPGWRLRRGGQPLETIAWPAEGAFLSYLLPAGRYGLELLYDPVSQRLGLYLGLMGLGTLAWLGGLATGRRAATRTPRPAPPISSEGAPPPAPREKAIIEIEEI